MKRFKGKRNLRDAIFEITDEERQPVSVSKLLPLEKVKILQEWFDTNQQNKPDKSVREQLAAKSELTYTQVSEWFKRLSRPKSTRRIALRTKIILKEEFSKNQYPTREEKIEISNRCQIPIKTVTAWFASERFNCNKN